MTAADFIHDSVSRLRKRADDLRTFGATGPAQACEQIAAELESDFRNWWLTELCIADAAIESGYSEGRLRQMARDGELSHKKGNSQRGHLTIARCDLPRRPKPMSSGVTSLEERLLSPRQPDLRKPA